MVSDALLALLRCPLCACSSEGLLSLEREGYWLICKDCGRKYPIQAGIPVMLVEEADKWTGYEVKALPIPPPGF